MKCDRSLEWAMQGRKLSSVQVAELEKQLQVNTNDLKLRIMLLGKYWNSSSNTRRQEHLKWLIQNYSNDSVCGSPFACPGEDETEYLELKEIWLEQVERRRDDETVLVNAARFFTHKDPALSERFYTAAINLAPSNTQYKENLAHLYSLWPGHENQALEVLEKVCTEEENLEDLFYALTDLPEAAYAADELVKARSQAERLLDLAIRFKENWNYGNAINTAHTVLGRIALRNGVLHQAKFHLEASAIDIATPQTTSFGPTLDLATELAAAGEKECVVSYLDRHEELCGFNEWALELRFQILTNSRESVAYSSNNRAYEEFVQNHKVQALSKMDPLSRKKCLEKEVRAIKISIEIYSAEDPEKSETSHEDNAKYVERQKEFLCKLETLLAELD